MSDGDRAASHLVDVERLERSAPLRRIRISGGLARNDYLCRCLASLSALPVERPAAVEATARGAFRIGLNAADGIDGVKAMALLADSRSKKLGSWEISGDVLYFVIKLPDSIDGAALEAAMDIASETADNKEIELSGDKDEL